MSKKKTSNPFKAKRSAEGLPLTQIYLKPIKKKHCRSCSNCKLFNDSGLCTGKYPPAKPPARIFNNAAELCGRREYFKSYF